MKRFSFLIAIFLVNSNLMSQFNLDLKRESAIFSLGIASQGFGMATNSSITPLTSTQVNSLDRNTIHPFDRETVNHHDLWANDISNIGAIGLMASPIILFADKKIQKDWLTIAVMYGEVLGLATTLPNWCKNTVQRVRPFVYNPDVPIDKKMEIDAQRSFFSGHTCVAFSSAIFFSTVYSAYHPNSKLKPWIWTGSLLAASTVGYMRYQSGNHFPTDILVGAGVGAGIGYLIPLLHRTKKDNKLSIIPMYDNQFLGVNFSYKF